MGSQPLKHLITKRLKVGAVALNQTPLDWDGNLRNIRAAIAAARAEGVQLLCLPELCVTGYNCEDTFHAAGVLETAAQMLLDLLPDTQGLVVSLGMPILMQNGLFNCACLVVDGEIIGFAAKQYLAGDGIHYEPRWFKPWQADIVSEVRIGAKQYPMGDLLFDVGGVRIGFEICEDAWVPTRPGSSLARNGVDLILNPSASHFAFGKLEVRRRFVLEGSRAFGVTYIYSNLLGNEAGRAIYDGGSLIASNGQMCAEGPRFSFQEMVLTSAVIDLDRTRMGRARTASFRPSFDDESERTVSCDYGWVSSELTSFQATRPAWEASVTLKEEEYTRAVSLAMFDYLRKSRSRGFVVSLSGGADSATVCCHVAQLVSLGVQELGLEGFCKRLGYMPELKQLGLAASASHAEVCRALVGRLLSTAYQATVNSSEVTRHAAAVVAEAVGATHMELNIEEQVRGYVSMIEKGLGRALTWERDDIALQNVQARVRAPSIWLLANIKGALLLSTSNRSEAAVGYATMDGDTAGGLSPLAGIDKAFIRQYLRWLESTGPLGLGAMPALKVINDQQPTAELRPLERVQTDEADLMPYTLLDFIERSAVRDKCMPLECYQLCRHSFPQYTSAQLLTWVERFFRLWCRNQWKRERYAPSFHLDDESLDPKTWCRFPILSGGFERELRELRAWVASNEAAD